MSETCTHDCSSCKSNCDHRAPQHEPPHARSRIQKVIGVVSGKGGVGKSMTSAMLAVSMRRLGFKAGVLDADITGPSIPRLFGVKGPATGDGESINPVCSRTGVEIMSINLLLDDPEAPVVWRGPVIAGAVKQFWQEVVWDVDFLFVDMPPGTGDVPLTVFQTLPVDGIVIVSSPQELVGMIVGTLVCYALGTVWFCFQANYTVSAALAVCVIPFIPADLIKMVLAMSIGPEIRKRLGSVVQ